MKVSILTLGCKVNQSESAIIEGNLINNGFSIVGLSEQPDYCIINTCTVTAKSDYQSRQLIRRAVRARSKVIVTGCYSQLRPDEIKNIDRDIKIVDNGNKLRIINMLSNNIKSITYNHFSRSRPYVKVQDGCNFTCTYCIVPKARGRSRSLDIKDVVMQALELEQAGFHEIVLTGIHLGYYGYDLKPKATLAYLVKTLLEQTKIDRIRLSSVEVKEVHNELIELLQERRLCKHIHIPLQSGDDTVLNLMNRTYTSGDYERVVEQILYKVPGIAIGTDVIVGFPAEDHAEFLNTKKLLDSIPIAYMHIFPFSSRPDTIASNMANQKSFHIKKERFNDLNSLNIEKKRAYMISNLNKTLDVITEEPHIDNTIVGTSSNYLKVRVSANGYPKGSLIYVDVSGIEGDMLVGDVIDHT
jgi:threonylcarbamoyladenosine tRNA methylthiotransferase MtaB